MKTDKSKEQTSFKETLSYWIDSTEKTNYPSLEDDITVDVAIVGGGMVGITCAYLLKQDGLSVAVVEAKEIIGSTTGHTTAKITSQHSLVYDKIKKHMGDDKARQYAEANEFAIQEMAQLIKKKNIDCDFAYKSSYVFTQSNDYIEKIENEVKAASSLGIKAVFDEDPPLPFPVKASVRFDGQAQFHPRKYLLALAKDIPGGGSHIFEDTRVTGYEEKDGIELSTEQGRRVKAKKVIVASHYPIFDKSGFYFARIYQDRSYVVAVKMKEKFPDGMFINCEKPTRSLRSVHTKDGEIVLVVGDRHKTGQGENTINHYEKLLDFARENYTIEDVLYMWSTQDCMTLDGIPYVGQLTSDTRNMYVATGFGKWGMTNSTVSSIILKDLIVKGDSPWSAVYNPSRFTPVVSAKNFIVQNLNVAGKFISGKMETLTLSDDFDVKKGEGKAIELKGKRLGVYRDDADILHIVDTTCTHMLCELEWNDAEKSWDCPCHGSRFTYEGKVIQGPAIKPLEHQTIESKEEFSPFESSNENRLSDRL